MIADEPQPLYLLRLIVESYETVLKDLSAGGFTPILIGGAALRMYGSTRPTEDADIVYDDLKKSVAVLYRNGFQVIAGIKKLAPNRIEYETYATPKSALYAVGLRRRKAYSAIHAETHAKLDVWLDPSVPAARLKMNAVRMRVGKVDLLVAAPEDIIELKKAAIRDNPKRADKDNADIAHLSIVLQNKKRRSGRSD